ncbi:hypothetical protein [Mesonia sp. HuA40]|uniref:hypothetical protein n=1 Tax=Mesonia sp. HuA40 TaxID=2602761 RepID=UPI0011CB3209|nr:hypothetical protein [Mesonia sp. HuA40]TXK70863.1 hypothetical protein FT993_09745 [Mesonia sp. HuA40]
MSYGAGHIMDMISRMKQNRNLRPSNRSKFKENNRQSINSTADGQEKPFFKKIAPDKLKQINAQIQFEAKRQRKKERLIYGVFYICFALALIRLLVWLH